MVEMFDTICKFYVKLWSFMVFKITNIGFEEKIVKHSLFVSFFNKTISSQSTGLVLD